MQISKDICNNRRQEYNNEHTPQNQLKSRKFWSRDVLCLSNLHLLVYLSGSDTKLEKNQSRTWPVTPAKRKLYNINFTRIDLCRWYSIPSKLIKFVTACGYIWQGKSKAPVGHKLTRKVENIWFMVFNDASAESLILQGFEIGYVNRYNYLGI